MHRPDSVTPVAKGTFEVCSSLHGVPHMMVPLLFFSLPIGGNAAPKRGPPRGYTSRDNQWPPHLTSAPPNPAKGDPSYIYLTTQRGLAADHLPNRAQTSFFFYPPERSRSGPAMVPRWSRDGPITPAKARGSGRQPKKKGRTGGACHFKPAAYAPLNSGQTALR